MPTAATTTEDSRSKFGRKLPTRLHDEAILLDRLAGLFIDELLAQAVAGGFVDLAECDPLSGRGGRMERNRTGDQSQLEAVVTRL